MTEIAKFLKPYPLFTSRGTFLSLDTLLSALPSLHNVFTGGAFAISWLRKPNRGTEKEILMQSMPHRSCISDPSIHHESNISRDWVVLETTSRPVSKGSVPDCGVRNRLRRARVHLVA